MAVGSGVSVGAGVAMGSEVAVGAWVGISVLLTSVVGSAVTAVEFAAVGPAGAAVAGAEAVSVASTAFATTSGSGVGLPHPARPILKTAIKTMIRFTMRLLPCRR